MQSSTTKNCPCQGATLVRFVQPIILSTLSRGPSHGHLLLEKIACTRLWGGSPPDPAGVYRTLRGMEQRGLISSRQTVGMGRGPARRLFALTPAGELCCRKWLCTLRQYRLGLDEVISFLEEMCSV